MGDSFKNQHLEQLQNIRISMQWIISAHAVSLPHIEGFHFKQLPRKPWLVYPFSPRSWLLSCNNTTIVV